MSLNNQGFLNNTLCHEGFHWFRHRIYAVICLLLHGKVLIAGRNTEKAPNQSEWTNEQWVEWQARSVTPRILMPIKPFKKKAEELFAKHPDWSHLDEDTIYEITKELAGFFAVSLQSARIRLIETGFILSDSMISDIFNDDLRLTTFINEADAFQEYCENLEFRKLVDSNAVCYAENRFVANTLRNTEQSHGKLRLTDFARKHLNESALKFTLKGYRPLKGIAYRSDNKNNGIPRYERERNDDRVLETTDRLQQLAERFENEYQETCDIIPTFTELASEILTNRRWSYKTFVERTYLDTKLYYAIKKKKPIHISLRTVAAFCIGISANIDIADKLFEAAGYAVNNSREIQAYRFVINMMRGRRIDDCNALLERIGFKPLGPGVDETE
jgi:hypothetical protein